MELRVDNQTKDSGGTVTVATNGSAPAASLLGAACQEFKVPMDPRLGLYTKNNVMLSDRKTITDYGLNNGDTVYLRPKREGDDLLFLLNWRVLAIVLLLISIVGLIVLISIYAATAGRAPFIYGVVIDAGSSHSEATLYHWHGSKYFGTGKAEQVAHAETDAAGISEMRPREVQRSIDALLQKIKEFLPATEIERTPVFLAATAGMRLLNITSEVRADIVLLAAETAIKGSGMTFGGAEILTGQDEGLSAWLSANYLLDRLPRSHLSDSGPLVGAMDCGGASTQIAFEVEPERQHREFRRMKLYGHRFNVFSRSYLCFGSNEAFNRYLMMLLREQSYDVDKPIESPCHPKGFDGSTALSKIITPCTTHKDMPDNLRDMNLTDLRIIGTGKPLWCSSTVSHLFSEKECRAMKFNECFSKVPIDVPNINYTAISGFTYTIQQLRFEGRNMSDLKQTTQAFCSLDFDTMKQDYFPEAAAVKYAPSACFRANYMRSLLENYGVSDETFANVDFRRQAKGYNLGWSLGYMINKTNAIPEAEPYPALVPLPWFTTVLLVLAALLAAGVFSLLTARRRSHRIRAKDNDKDNLPMKETVA